MKKRAIILSFVVWISFLLSPALIEGNPTSQAQSGLYPVSIEPRELPQGRTALLRMTASPDVTQAAAIFDGRDHPMYLSIDGDWVALIPSDVNSERGAFEIEIRTWRGEEENPPQYEPITILWGSFFYQDIALPFALSPLLDPEVNQREEGTLELVHSRFTPQKWWRGSLQPPVPGPMISEFGGIRTYNNGVYEGRHTGTDYRAGMGEPNMAAGHGRVVFASPLPIRGNHVVIDHGFGVLTGYSHLSDVLVVPGQHVLAGDIIGLIGSTGRSQGAHMHLEVIVNGIWVDPPQFMSLNIPEAATIPVAERSDDG